MNRVHALDRSGDPDRFVDVRLAIENAGQPDISFSCHDRDVHSLEGVRLKQRGINPFRDVSVGQVDIHGCGGGTASWHFRWLTAATDADHGHDNGRYK